MTTATKFTDLQQRIINKDMRTMPPEMVNEILADMKPGEANEFLRQLGHVRARDVYDNCGREDEHGN